MALTSAHMMHGGKTEVVCRAPGFHSRGLQTPPRGPAASKPRTAELKRLGLILNATAWYKQHSTGDWPFDFST